MSDETDKPGSDLDALQLIAEHADDVLVHVGPDGRITYVSPTVTAYGYEPEELVGTTGAQIFHPEERARFAKNLAALLKGEVDPTANRRFRIRTKAGAWLWIESNPRATRDEDGKPAGFINVVRNVDDRKRLGDIARERGELFEAAFKHSATGKIVLDMDSRILRVNPALLATLGYRTEDLIGKRDDDFTHPDEIGRFADQYRALLAGKIQSYSLTRRYLRRDGVYIWCTLVVAMAAGPDGEPKFILGELQDQTIWRATEAELHRQKAEAEAALADLRRSERRFQRLAEGAIDIIIQYDREGVLRFVSPAFERVLGRDPDAYLGRPIWELVEPEQRALSADRVRRLVEDPGSETWEASPIWRLVHADGRIIYLQGSTAPMTSASGDIEDYVTILRDVTARTAMEEELRRKRAEAEAAAVAKAQFLANMSHEIRTPLTGVIGFAELLGKQQGLSDKARTYIDRINAGGRALLAIVNDVLEFSRLEAGRIKLDPQVCDLEALLDQAIGLVQNDADAKGLALRLERRGALPVAVTVDQTRLIQVILNLLNNAIKFTHAGSVTLAVSHERRGWIRVEVTDTGVGVSPDQARMLFQRFSQIDDSNTREFGGAGLGLSISKGLVELMAGEIGLESVEGRGSTFWFTVQAPVATLAAEDDAEEQGEAGIGMRGPLNILVVDDAPTNRELITAILSARDVHFTEAANGAEAVEAAARSAFDLILMDLQMPVMDGLAATRTIRAGPGLNDATPILAVTANIMPPQVKSCLEAGMNDHIGKPINRADLLNKIAHWTSNPDARTG